MRRILTGRVGGTVPEGRPNVAVLGILGRRIILFGATALTLGLGGCFPRDAGPELEHFDSQAPALGQPAPNFALTDVDGEKVSLDQLIGSKPIVLQLGSHSCPVYRYRRFSMETLRKKYAGRVHFQMIYTLEAHPAGSKSPYAEGEWLTWWNRMTDVRVRQPGTTRERMTTALMSRDTLALNYSVAVDTMDDTTWRAYGAASSPGFVIDRNGRIVLRQVWIDPEEIDTVLDSLLTRPLRPARLSRLVPKSGSAQ